MRRQRGAELGQFRGILHGRMVARVAIAGSISTNRCAPQVLIATRDLADITPRVDANRVAAQDWAVGRISR